MRLIIILISLAALGLAATVAALGPGTRFGYWDYSFALGLMRHIALPTLMAAGLGGLAFLLALWKARGLAVLALFATLAAGAAGFVPLKMRALAQANPFIHDITTDFDDPPEIVAAADAPRKNPAAYAGADLVRGSDKTVAEAQRSAFPHIAPLIVSVDMATATNGVHAVLSDMNLEIIADQSFSLDSGDGRRIEAVATSTWYGFKDDFIVRLAPQADGVRIDVRSKSRVGLSDLGANAARVRAFLKGLDAAL